MKALMGRKVGMTRIFDAQGKAIPVSLVKIDPNIVTQVKTPQKEGYTAVQLASGVKKHPTKPLAGHLKKAGIQTAARIFEAKDLSGLEVGQKLDVSIFQQGEEVSVSGISKGKGFAGVIKRYGAHGGPETHGSDHHRQPGSIGSSWPQRVVKGKKMPGHMGAEKVSVSGITVVSVDQEKGLLALKGAIPGPTKGWVMVKGISGEQDIGTSGYREIGIPGDQEEKESKEVQK